LEFAVENIQFWCEVELFRQVTLKQVAKRVVKDNGFNDQLDQESEFSLAYRNARTIYQKYVSANAPYTVNLSDAMAQSIYRELKTLKQNSKQMEALNKITSDQDKLLIGPQKVHQAYGAISSPVYIGQPKPLGNPETYSEDSTSLTRSLLETPVATPTHSAFLGTTIPSYRMVPQYLTNDSEGTTNPSPCSKENKEESDLGEFPYSPPSILIDKDDDLDVYTPYHRLANIFDEAQQEIYGLLAMGSFPRYKQSPLYQNFLREHNSKRRMKHAMKDLAII